MAPPASDVDELGVGFAQLPTSMSGNLYAYGPGGGRDVDVQMSHGRPGNLSDSDDRKNSFLSLNNPFKPKRTKEGQPAKKRGPKPDSKPAASRRQELNRQAQRTHRERKELYTKQMEGEVVRLKEVVAEVSKEAEQAQQENERLRQLLKANGISYDCMIQDGRSLSNESLFRSPNSGIDFAGQPHQNPYDMPYAAGHHGSGPPAHYTSSSHSQGYSSRSISHEASVSPPPAMPRGITGLAPLRKSSSHSTEPGINIKQGSSPISTVIPYNHQHPESFLGVRGTPPEDNASVPRKELLDVDQIGIEFVLELERNCHGHKTLMSARTFNDEDPDSLGGHALMLTVIPEGHLVHTPDVCYPHQAPKTSKAGLLRLMDLSTTLPVRGGEIPPAMAWKYIRLDERFPWLDLTDLQDITTELKGRCRCYGWGAVVEQFEVQDVLDELFAKKEDASFPRTAAAFTFQ